MTLMLASVTGPQEAEIAVAHGADIIDLKDSANGAFGAVTPDVARATVAATKGQRPVSAVSGELPIEPGKIVAAATAMADAGVANVKVGLRGCALLIMALLSLPPVAGAQERSAAIFDFELTDTSRDNQFAPTDAEHQARLAMVSARLRARLAESGRFSVADIAPVAKEAHASNLQSCGGCDVSLAGKIGADLAITGMVYKVSNLILNMMIFVRDAKTGDNVAVAQADMRGDTDESWNRTLDWLVRNRLLAPDYGARR